MLQEFHFWLDGMKESSSLYMGYSKEVMTQQLEREVKELAGKQQKKVTASTDPSRPCRFCDILQDIARLHHLDARVPPRLECDVRGYGTQWRS